ncbi:hypothetical protein E1180_02590 [Roseibium denhamense]|nr:hypothetical protein [Roseibium denhamense]MTI04403.1 hypothetical protein [Roseibium denhamense]
MTPMSLPDPIGLKPGRFSVLAVSIAVLAAAYLADRIAYWTWNWDTAASRFQYPQILDVEIGPSAFAIPSDLLVNTRQKAALASGRRSVPKLSLEVTWPELSAVPQKYPASRTANRTITIDLESNPGRETMRARLDPFYRRLARGGELDGPAGLTVLRLSRKNASSDIIAFDPTTPNGFIARCSQDASTGNSVCHRAVAFQKGIEIRYRFDRDLLADWQVIEHSILGKVTSFRRIKPG